MKRCFLHMQNSDHRLNPINRDLITNGQEYSPVMLDLFIEFVALVAHGNPLETRTEAMLIGLPDIRLKWELVHRPLLRTKKGPTVPAMRRPGQAHGSRLYTCRTRA